MKLVFTFIECYNRLLYGLLTFRTCLLQLEYEFLVPTELMKPVVVSDFAPKLRNFKTTLRQHLKGKNTLEEMLAARPAYYHKEEWWKGFVMNEMKKGASERRAKAKLSALKRIRKHKSGRQTYANKVHKMVSTVLLIHYAICKTLQSWNVVLLKLVTYSHVLLVYCIFRLKLMGSKLLIWVIKVLRF